MQIAVANSLKGGEPSEGDRLLVPAAYHEVIPAVRTPRTFKARAGAKRPSSATASAKRPLHPAAGTTLAQLKDRNRSLNR
jgi:hypothetical protein